MLFAHNPQIAAHRPNFADLPTKTENGKVISICPPGAAWGSSDLRSRGRGADYALVDVWPREHFRVFTGGERKWRDINFGRLMFQQEIYVYLLELGFAMQQAFDSLKTEVVEELHAAVCPNCEIHFTASRKRKFCSATCCRKYQAWKNLNKYHSKSTEEVRLALAGYKPKIAKEGFYWRITGFNTEGTYTRIKKRFRTFSDAVKFVSAIQEAS